MEEETLEVHARNGSVIFIPPDYLRLSVSKPDDVNTTVHFHYEMAEGYYSDTVVSAGDFTSNSVFQGPDNKQMNRKVCDNISKHL